jgi:hypothetical protein
VAKKNDIAFFEAGRSRLAEFQVDMAAQVRKHFRHRHAGFLA